MSEQKLITKQNDTISRRDFLKLSSFFVAAATISDFALNGQLKTLVAQSTPAAPKQDQWIKSGCRICASLDYINVHVVDGMIDKIEGYPDPIRTRGKLCARGASGLWFVYDPYRVKAPLKRTNPQKGIGVDPKWVEISWDEAYNTIAQQAKNVRAKGKNGNMWFNDFSRLNYTQGEFYNAFKAAMAGDAYRVEMGMNWCGHVSHYMFRLAHGAFVQAPDYRYCKYLLSLGGEIGFVGDATHLAESLVQAHSNGMRIVTANPVLSNGPNTTDEWISIYPATDGAFASAMLNVLIHELGIYDVDFIKKWTDGSYLIRADNGYFARDKATNKPLIWDPVDNKAKTFDDPTFKDYAIEGTFTVDGVNTNPAWQLLKQVVKPMTPEWAAPITTVSAATIRRIASEFGQAAQVGSTVVNENAARPLRPVAVIHKSNASNHVHGFANDWSAMLLPMIMGAFEVPGAMYAVPGANSMVGTSPLIPWDTPAADMRWHSTNDGLIPHPDASYTLVRSPPYQFEFPPQRVELEELFPLGDHFGAVSTITMSHPNDYWSVGKNHRIEFGFAHAYGLLSMFAVKTIADNLSTIPFLAASCIFMEEITDFADIVLPDRVYLENYMMAAGWLEQPVVQPLNPIPYVYDQFIEIADRSGQLYGKGGFIDQLNAGVGFKDQYKLDLNKKYSTEEIFDRICLNINGQGLDWWKQNGGIPEVPPFVGPGRDPSRGPTPTEWYKTRKLRLPIYVELHKRVADQLRANLEKNGVTWNYDDYATLPKWIPSHIHTETPPYDLVEVAYISSNGGFLSTNSNPWIADMNEKLDPYTLYVWMNEDTAKAKGIADGDLIWVESEQDKRQAIAKLSQVVHPKAIAVSRNYGRWAGNSVVKSLSDRHLGVSHQALRPLKLEYIDKLNAALENLIKVKVYKA